MKTTPHRNPRYGPWAVWLAAILAILGAIAPTVTHALMRAGGQPPQGIEICTAIGPRWVSAGNSESSDDSNPVPGSFASAAHCQFCLQTTDRGALINDPLPHPFMVQDIRRKSTVRQFFLYATAHSFNPPPRGPPGFF
jgi:hypothetical protein